MGEQINLVIDNIANRLGVTIDKLYPILMKQALIDGVGLGISAIISLIVLIISGICFKRIYFNRDMDSADRGIVLTLLTILSIIAIITVLCLIMGSISAIFNPEYYIINVLRKGM